MRENSIEQRLARLTKLVGNAPLLAIAFLYRGRKRVIYAKAENLNMTGGIRDGLLAPDVHLEGFRAFRRVCHVCCDPLDCTQGPETLSTCLMHAESARQLPLPSLCIFAPRSGFEVRRHGAAFEGHGRRLLLKAAACRRTPKRGRSPAP